MSLSEKVVERVAEAEDVNPSELEKPLYEVVDADALDAIFESVEDGPTRDTGKVEFQYHGYEIIVDAEGNLIEIQDENPRL